MESLNYPDEGSEWLMFFSILLTLALLLEGELLFSFSLLTNKGKERVFKQFNLATCLWTLSERYWPSGREENQVQAKTHQLPTFFLLLCSWRRAGSVQKTRSLSSLYPQYTQEPFLVQSLGGDNTQAAINCFRSWLFIKVFLDFLEKIICNRLHHNFCWGK